MSDRIVARWETRGKDYLELTKDEGRGRWYSYKGNGCGGGFEADSDAAAIQRMENPWGHPDGTGQVTVLKTDRPSLRRVK
jgi:hypothetical protein